MKKWLRIFIYIFVLITGSIAGIGLLIMDEVLTDLINPVMIAEAPQVPEELDAQSLNIKIDDDVFARGYYVHIPESEFVVLLTHDCNGHMYHRFELIEAFKELGISVLAIDFRGFGMSDETEISDETFHEDLKDMYSTLRRKQWSSSRIIIYGQGIGAGIQGDLLLNSQCAAWIMDNPIPSLKDSASNPIAKMLTVDRLSVYPALENVKSPVQIIYDDTVTSQEYLDQIVSVYPETVLCQCKGARVRGQFDTVDWDQWKVCMETLLGKLKSPDKPVPIIPAKPVPSRTVDKEQERNPDGHEQ